MIGIEELTEQQESVLEKNIVLIFPLPQTEWLSKIIPYKANVIIEPMLGEHLAIVTDRRTEGFSTNKDFHGIRPHYFFADAYEQSWNIFLRKLILNRIHVQFHDLNKHTIIIEHPASNFAADTIVNCLPNSKVIILVSDGRNYVERQVSTLLRNKQVKDGLKSYSVEEKIPFIEQQSKRWVKMMEILLSIETIHSKDYLMIIKIDEILNDIPESLEKIYRFLEIKIEKKELEKIRKKIENEKRKNSMENFIAKWENTFSDKEKEMMNKILGSTLKKLKIE